MIREGSSPQQFHQDHRARGFALTLASVAEFLGPVLFGIAVAATIGKNLVQFSAITITVLLVAIASALAWSIATLFVGLPSSSTHALLRGLIGAVAIQSGPQALLAAIIEKSLIVENIIAVSIR